MRQVVLRLFSIASNLFRYGLLAVVVWVYLWDQVTFRRWNMVAGSLRTLMGGGGQLYSSRLRQVHLYGLSLRLCLTMISSQWPGYDPWEAQIRMRNDSPWSGDSYTFRRLVNQVKGKVRKFVSVCYPVARCVKGIDSSARTTQMLQAATRTGPSATHRVSQLTTFSFWPS